MLKRAEKQNGLGKTPTMSKRTLSFSEVVQKYNPGISEDEIRAWVWYRRSIGIPMSGWEKYFIDSKTSTGEEADLLVAKRETMIKDNHFRDLKNVPVGTILGKRINKTHSYDKTTFQFFRDSEGIKMANVHDVQQNKGASFRTDSKELHKLVVNGALYYLGGELLPYPVYSYGNMYDRELKLKKDEKNIIDFYGQDVYNRHVRAVKESKPEFLSLTNPDPKQRPKILAVSKFARNMVDTVQVNVEQLRPETGVLLDAPMHLEGAFRKYLDSLEKADFEESSASDIRQYYLDKKNAPRDFSPELKAELKRATRNEGERLFDRFLHEALTFEDQQKIDYTWNRLYNGQSNVAVNRIPIGFEVSCKFQNFDFELRPAQREGVAFMEMMGSGIIAYDVGVGKTITAIAELANSLQSGKCKRPLIIVPNATYKKWVAEIIGENGDDGELVEGILSGTGAVVNDWYNLGTNHTRKVIEIKKVDGKLQRVDKPVHRTNFNANVKEKVITIVTYEGFKKIGFSNEVGEELFFELVHILEQKDYERSVRDTEINYQKYREIVGIGNKGTIADIDKLGFDYIVMDEAHKCKNIFEKVKANDQGEKRFGIEGATSETGKKAFFLCNYVQRRYGRNVMLLTATPFSNSPLEIYSMLSLVAYQGLRDMGIYHINDFFERHVLESTEDTVNMKEEIVQKDVVKTFNNRLLLQKLIYNHINYKTGDEAGVRRPCKINLPRIYETTKDGKLKRLASNKQTLTYLRMTPRQRYNQKEIVDFANEARRMSNDMLRAMNHSLNNALHPCLFDKIMPEDYKEFVEESAKIKYTVECIRSVRDYHLKRNEHISGQVIYANRGKDYFHYIKEYLEKEVGYKTGVKWGRYKIDEVEIITSSVSATKKERIKEAFLAGVCKVIIGTATIREGIDLQKKGTVIYNLFPDWNPTDLRQLEGRIWRQKNEYGYVRITLPLVQDSMDVFVFQKLEEKTSRINEIWYRGDRGNVLDLESLDPEEIKFALLTDPDAIATSIINKDIKKQDRVIMLLEDKIATLENFTSLVKDYERHKSALEEAVRKVYINMQSFSYIQAKPTTEKLKQLEKKQRDEIKKDIALFNELSKFLEKTPYADKELQLIARKVNNRFDYFDSYKLKYFTEDLYAVKKGEKTLLSSKGYTIDDDIEAVIKEYKGDLQKAEKGLDYIKSEKYRRVIVAEVRDKKSAMQVSGKSVGERVREFAGLNHVLSYKFACIDPEACIIPSKELSPGGGCPKETELEQELSLLKLKIRIRKKMLELIEI